LLFLFVVCSPLLLLLLLLLSSSFFFFLRGYKLNIFYPDLIDKSKPPTYSVRQENKEYSILTFHAGPPYEDIAFRVVNKEWEMNHRRGFRCVFDRGVLSLVFNLKRYRYRR
jgi:cactin